LRTFHLNLATRPYRDYRPVYAVVVAASLLTALLLLNNVDTFYRYTQDTRTTRARIAELERRTADEQRAADQLSHRVGTVDLKTLNAEARYVNTQIAQRAFSWSELLDQMETVLPRSVRVNNLQPTFDKSGLVHLSLSCSSRSPDGLIDTINGLNRAARFSKPFPTSTVTDESGETHFTIGVDYLPNLPRRVE
jgi:type IV pilus assembly protein PilN